MKEVTDSFLLTMAEISAGLVGLFLVGVLFYVESGFRRAPEGRLVERYFRAATAIVLVLYAMPIFLSLTLVVLDVVWSRVLFAMLSVLLLAANLQTAIRVRGIASRVVVVNEAVATLATLPLLLTPWVLGGLEPSREDLTWAILLAFGLGFLSVGTLVLAAFDIAGMSHAESEAQEEKAASVEGPPPAQT